MKQETYNKLETIIHGLYEFQTMIEEETRCSACKIGGLPGDVCRINNVVKRTIGDLEYTRDHMHNIDRLEKADLERINSFSKTTNPEPSSETRIVSVTNSPREHFKELMENPKVKKIYVDEEKAREFGLPSYLIKQ